MKTIKYFILAVTAILGTANYAQNKLEYNPVEVHLQFKSSYFSRGLTISDVPFIMVSANFISKDGNFKFGARGSNSFNGTYKQFDYFASYKYKKFRFLVYDIYNHSTYFAPKADLFDYNAATTRHFVDATIGYKFYEKFPLDISWSTVVFGRDRDALPGEVREEGKDPVRNGKNRYSSYVQLSYPCQINDVKFDFFLGGVFALTCEQDTFFSNKPGIATFGFNATKVFKLDNYTFPITASPIWNTLKNTGGVVFTANLF